MTWTELMGRKKVLLGRNFEMTEYFGSYRGPIKFIKMEGEFVVIQRIWTAKRSIQGHPKGPWKKFDGAKVTFRPNDCPEPQEAQDGTITFETPIGRGVIFPKGDNLDSGKVTALFLEAP